ncbi:uncharacterized protein CYBJADRAFT_174020 [Cyberlindnera jadinii NRRL Y-1542]|uniref:Transcription elongation factor Eaf N-terminal domain-containing protein n=1 Tax=Cyberlindnera jadinii (strain ATCC 18201 / CBS 1600 / BCRC 20928 / JCM 3617 / NBRC 0987 / NRRL Y-1542) TaxID=983966 RepID=A0A1E4RZ84_CYBJN|nr:hypothetical protein CYBJADRAFT_174020 [Cyberlindnera jadinii NRRL Y-1542]ODV72580.1 hypothetical protein CYBJADRAFT_174020 [Cyberlindnera jadinii NRRL Y-1542]
MSTDIADGEYEIRLPDSLVAQWRGASGARADPNSELLSLSCGQVVERPDDESQTCELKRHENSTFELKTRNKDGDELTYSGSVTQPKDTECMLVYNEKLRTFELRLLSTQLRASEHFKIRPKRIEKAAPRRKKPETSIFAPKTRPMSPLTVSSGVKRSASSTPVNMLPDDEVPLALTSPKKNVKSRPLAPSPLTASTSSTSPSRKVVSSASAKGTNVKAKSTLRSRSTTPTTSKLGTPSLMVDSPAMRPPSPQAEGQRAVRPQVASKKPPSATAMTPTVTQVERMSDEDEDDFDALVDELEGELQSDDMIIEDAQPSTTPSVPNNFDFDYNGKRPMSFRDLAGMGKNDDEDELSSSSEEE